MKRLLIFLLSFLTIKAARAQNFPVDFLGHWKGEIEWFQQGNKTPKKVPVQIRIQRADTTGQYTWQIIYGKDEKDNRPYLLKPIDTASGHWVIDERNGIILDQYWMGNKLSGVFSVEPTTIFNTYWLENGKLLVEFILVSSKPSIRTGAGTEASPFVDSYQLKSFQRGALLKVQ